MTFKKALIFNLFFTVGTLQADGPKYSKAELASFCALICTPSIIHFGFKLQPKTSLLCAAGITTAAAAKIYYNESKHLDTEVLSDKIKRFARIFTDALLWKDIERNPKFSAWINGLYAAFMLHNFLAKKQEKEVDEREKKKAQNHLRKHSLAMKKVLDELIKTRKRKSTFATL